MSTSNNNGADRSAATANNAPADAPVVRAIPSTRDELIQLYRTAGHPIAFSAPEKVYQFFKGRLTREFIQDALDHVDSYTLHREFKRPNVYNPYYAYIRRKDFQADLIDIAGLKDANDDTSYLNLVIDTFSRKIWIIPQKNKTGSTTRQAMEAWLSSISRDSHPAKHLLTDNGKEYSNLDCRRLFRQFNVKHDTTQNVLKASIAERANKSVQILIYKYLTDKGEQRYIDILPSLVKTYNNRPHRSLENHSPNFADKKTHELLIRSIHARRYASRHKKLGRKKKFKVGDRVRVKTYATSGISTVRRAYLQQFKGELFTVESVNTTLPVPMFNIKSMDTEEDIDGGFYSNELQLVKGDTFKIEKVLRRRGRGDNEEFYVKWKYFGNRWNSWVKKDDLVLDEEEQE